MLSFKNVLCLSPHPDDIEFSMGGTISRNCNTNFTSLVFSTGSANDPVSDETRWEECRQYWKDTRNINQLFLAPLLNTHSEEEWINLIETRINLRQYQALFLPPLLDTHYEHRLVHGIGMALTRAKPLSIIEYKSVSVLDSWVPNLFVMINDFYAEEKIEKLKKFESQQKRYFKPEYVKASHIHLNSMKKGIELPVEQFRIVSLYT